MTELDRNKTLVHYTKSAELVASVLQHGFLLVPNPRELINRLMEPYTFDEREPQQFGMVSFTEIEESKSTTHRERFGQFGIAVTWDWAFRNRVQRVLYIDEGAVLESFQDLFALAIQELDRANPSEGREMILNNKTVAGLTGLSLYPRLLTLYEFMQPERDSAQLEWRIVSEIPNYCDLSRPRPELIASLLETAKIWKGFSLRLEPSDIRYILCPRSARRRLQLSIPDGFRNVPLRLTVHRSFAGLASTLEIWRATRQTQIPLQARREEPRRDLLRGVAYVPDMLEIEGMSYHGNAVDHKRLLEVSYIGPGRERYTIRVLLDAIAEKKAWIRNLLERIAREHPEKDQR